MLFGSNAILKEEKEKQSKEEKKHNFVMGWGGDLSDLGSDVWPCRRNLYSKASSPQEWSPRDRGNRDSKVEERKGNSLYISF